MRMRAMLVIVVALVLPVLSQSEVLYLKDGSTLQGKLIRLSNDTLYVKTSFGPIVPMHRSVVIRIDFDSMGVPTGMLRQPAPAVIGVAATSDAPPGTLLVHFDRFQLSSEVIVTRNKNKAETIAANAIESLLLVDGEKRHSEIDDVMDKEIRKGPETMYRNQMQPTSFQIVLPEGRYHCDFRVVNSKGEPYIDSFSNGMLDKRLVRDEVFIRSRQITQMRIGLKKKMKGLGASYLYEIIH